jgi:hypothetical protein
MIPLTPKPLILLRNFCYTKWLNTNSMKRTPALFILGFLLSLAAAAQQTTFSKVFDGGGWASRIINSYDRGYYIIGYSSALLFKIDSAGTIEWNKNYDDVSNYLSSWQISSLQPTFDSCLILAGYAYNVLTSKTVAVCIKLSAGGDTLWGTEITHADMGLYAGDVKQTADSGYIITGLAGEDDAVLVAKLSSSGTLEWSKLFTAANSGNRGNAVRQCPDGGYLVAGTLLDYPPLDEKAFLLKLTSTGTVSWAKKYYSPSSSYSLACDLQMTTAGSISLMKIGNKLVLMKTDDTGNIVWTKAYNEPYVDMANSNHLLMTSDNHLLINLGAMWGSSISKSDSSGNILWSRMLMIDGVDAAEASDKGFMALGNGPMLGVKSQYDPQIGIIKTDTLGYSLECVYNGNIDLIPLNVISSAFSFTSLNPCTGSPLHLSYNSISFISRDGCVDVTGSLNEVAGRTETQIYPNPSAGIFKLEAPAGTHIEISNPSGQVILQFETVSSKTELDMTRFADGLYYLKSVNGNIRAYHKIIKN